MYEDEEIGADTAAFQAFQDAADYRPDRSMALRALMLLVVAAFAAIAWWLVQ